MTSSSTCGRRKYKSAANDSIAALQADVSSIKATISYLASKADLHAVEGALSARINALETKIIQWIVGTVIATAALAFSIAKFVS